MTYYREVYAEDLNDKGFDYYIDYLYEDVVKNFEDYEDYIIEFSESSSSETAKKIKTINDEYTESEGTDADSEKYIKAIEVILSDDSSLKEIVRHIADETEIPDHIWDDVRDYYGLT